MPFIRPAAHITGKTLVFRNATEQDAEFILALRTDVEKSRYLSPTSNHLTSQVNWLRNYSRSIGQAYFIIETNNARIGTVRLYDARNDSFCWGSWILISGRPKQAALESAIMVYAYAIDHLGFTRSHFDVRKQNTRVLQFHERLGAVRTGETGEDFLYEMPATAIAAARNHLLDILPEGVKVVW